MFRPHFDVLCDLLLNRRTATWNQFVLHNNKNPFFYFKIFQHNAKAGLCPRLCPLCKPFDVIYYLYKIKQIYWLLCVAKNCDWSRKIKPLSDLTRASLLVEWSRFKNPEENARKIKPVFVIRAQPCEPKSSDVGLKIAEAEKIPSKILWLWST